MFRKKAAIFLGVIFWGAPVWIDQAWAAPGEKVQELAPNSQQAAHVVVGGEKALASVSDDDVRINRKKIYFGSADVWTRAAVINGKQVMRATAAFKEMKRRGIDENHPEYDLYVQRAKSQMTKAIKQACEEQSPPFDLVGEKGAIQIKNRIVPEITKLVLAKLDDYIF